MDMNMHGDEYLKIVWGYEADPQWLKAKAIVLDEKSNLKNYIRAMMTMDRIEESYKRSAELYLVRGF